MLSKNTINIFGFRTQFMRPLGNVFPFRWNWSTGKLERNGNYGRWNFNLFLFYLNCYLLLLVIRFLRGASGTIGGVGSSSGFNHESSPKEPLHKISNSVESTDSRRDSPILNAVDVLFMSLIWSIGCSSSVIMQFAEDWVCLANMMINTDKKLQEKFATVLQFHPFAKKAASLIEFFTFIVAFVTAGIIPILAGASFLQNTNPLHRFFSQVLEIHITFQPRFIPLMMFSTWAFLIASSIAWFAITLIFLYLTSTIFWLTSLRPISVSQYHPGKYRTLLGHLDGPTILGIYRSLLVLNRQLTRCVGSPRIATHQSTMQMVAVSCTFITVRYFDLVINNISYSMFIGGPFLCIFTEYVETRIIATTIESSKRLLKELSKYLKWDLTFEAKILRKEIQASWKIRIDVAYPYYEINRKTFWEFIDVTVNFLVDALVAY